jgi:hypothetical protein
MVGLASNTLRFHIEKRDVNPSKIVNSSCVIKVSHTVDFHNAPNNSLKPALRNVLLNGLCSDVNLIVQDKTIPANKCILVVRSQKFATMITPDTKQINIPNTKPKIVE